MSVRIGIALAALAFAPAAVAKRPAAASALRIPLPAAGHVTLETFTITVGGVAPRRLPARLRLLPQRFKRLPPSVRIVVADRRILSAKRTRYVLLLLAINVASSGARAHEAQAAPPASDKLASVGQAEKLDDLAAMLMFYGSPTAALLVQQEEVEAREKLAHDVFMGVTAQAGRNADLGSGVPPWLPTTEELFGNDDTAPLDPSIDTGHYDDGHAFGWGVKGRADEAKVVRDAFEANLQDLVDTIEHDLGADINGDGSVSTGIDTIVGPVSCSPSPC